MTSIFWASVFWTETSYLLFALVLRKTFVFLFFRQILLCMYFWLLLLSFVLISFFKLSIFFSLDLNSPFTFQPNEVCNRAMIRSSEPSEGLKIRGRGVQSVIKQDLLMAHVLIWAKSGGMDKCLSGSAGSDYYMHASYL